MNSPIPQTLSQEEAKSTGNLWRQGWELLTPREQRFALVVLLISIVSALAAAAMVASIMPFLSVLTDPSLIQTNTIYSWAYEQFGFTSTYEFLVGLGLFSLTVIVVANLFQMLYSYASARFSFMRIHALSQRLLSIYLHQPYSFFISSNTGNLNTRILSEVQLVVERFFRPLFDLLSGALTILAIICLLLWTDPLVASISFLVLGSTYGLVFIVSRRQLMHASKRREKMNTARYRMAAEAFGGIKDIKLTGNETIYLARFGHPSRQMSETWVFAALVSSLPHYMVQIIAFGGMILLCLALISPDRLSDGNMMGELIPTIGLFAFSGQRLMPELGKVYRSLSDMRFAEAAVGALHADLLMRRPEAVETQDVPALVLRDRLELKAVSFQYPGAERAGLESVSLTVRAGERLGIVGGTGAGKTTLVDVLLGLLRPTFGEIRVDGTLLDDANIRAWQKCLSYVPQDIYLTDSSVAENIAFGTPPDRIDHTRVREAARIAQLDAFIQRDLPEGYATLVGEKGIRLSGGQRQRIGIARALYREAGVILFDEATSALDTLTEREVMSSIDALPGDTTVLMIAHRLSTVRNCDRIVVMERGRVIGLGTWDELLRDCAVFRDMVGAI